MSVLVVGLSHKSAPVTMLERAALTGDALTKLLHDVFQAEDVAGVLIVSTCNRVEVYAEVDAFHGGVAAISELLARHSGVPLAELTPWLYVHYADRAVQHLLAVTCGLESMVVGESQILGQVRHALSLAREQGTLSRPLSDLGALALRTGKRAHAETGIDRAGQSLVSVGLAAAARRLGQAGLQGTATLIVGAGSMSSLAATTAARLGAGPLVIANRTRRHAQRLAAAVEGTAADLSGLHGLIAAADLVVTCTGAAGHVITAAALRSVLADRAPAGRPLVLLDLALPRDVEAAAGQLPGVSVVGLEELAPVVQPGPDGLTPGALAAEALGPEALGPEARGSEARGPEARGLDAAAQEAAAAGPPFEQEIAAVRRIVAEEFAAQLMADRAALVTPTVVALRAKAAEVVDAEMARLAGRLAGIDARSRYEIAQAMRRIADKLLHAPTVRVKELAGSPGADSYEAALRVLFDLDPAVVQAVTRADAQLAGWPDVEDTP
ncbi:MAG: glutamyl-tRNA reductase [Streptosporangiaceae bacterium]